VGFDDYTRTLGPGEAGAKAAEPIWIDFMGKALAGKPAHNFPVPDNIEFARIDEKTGLLASSCSNETRIEAFIAGTAPIEASPCGPNPKAEDMLQSLDRY
jgi:penicillin-binding protein 1A